MTRCLIFEQVTACLSSSGAHVYISVLLEVGLFCSGRGMLVFWVFDGGSGPKPLIIRGWSILGDAVPPPVRSHISCRHRFGLVFVFVRSVLYANPIQNRPCSMFVSIKRVYLSVRHGDMFLHATGAHVLFFNKTTCPNIAPTSTSSCTCNFVTTL